ncbi:MAG: Asp-tRNA(Asn)/Glu-tRNA(Gln) amidotransferase subunit GatC [Arenicella sp.]
MELDNNTVKTIASLAKLTLSDEETEQYRGELSNILDLVAQLQACDTEGVQVMTHPMDATLRLRADEVTESDQREHFQATAPATENGLYLVPKVLD